MTDKEIIIDGVDIKECTRLWNGQCTGIDNKLLGNCIDLNCELKRLKRLEQENAELKAENAKLKSQIKDLQIRKDRYYLKGLEQERQISDYITILQEIKEIVEELSCKHPEECFENKPDWNGEVYGCDVADNWKKPSELATCPSKLASAILQIINKAEEEWVLQED